MIALDNALTLLAFLAAGAFGMRGWLIDQQNLTVRARDRFYANGLAMVGLLVSSMQHFDQHQWFWGGFSLLTAMSFMVRSEKWYRLWDTCRQSDRRIAAARLRGQQ